MRSKTEKVNLDLLDLTDAPRKCQIHNQITTSSQGEEKRIISQYQYNRKPGHRMNEGNGLTASCT